MNTQVHVHTRKCRWNRGRALKLNQSNTNEIIPKFKSEMRQVDYFIMADWAEWTRCSAIHGRIEMATKRLIAVAYVVPSGLFSSLLLCCDTEQLVIKTVGASTHDLFACGISELNWTNKDPIAIINHFVFRRPTIKHHTSPCKAGDHSSLWLYCFNLPSLIRCNMKLCVFKSKLLNSKSTQQHGVLHSQ